MPSFNPLRHVFEGKRKQYPNSRTYRTTFSKKIMDTFEFFCGRPSELFYLGHFGIFDYLTLGIPYLIFEWSRTTRNEGTGDFLFALGTIGLIVSLTPRYFFSALMTFISLPFVALAHGISKIKGDKLKATILEHQATLISDNNTPLETSTWGKLLADKNMQLEYIESIDLKTGSVIAERNHSLSFLGLRLDLEKSGLTEGSPVLAAIKELNVGYINNRSAN